MQSPYANSKTTNSNKTVKIRVKRCKKEFKAVNQNESEKRIIVTLNRMGRRRRGVEEVREKERNSKPLVGFGVQGSARYRETGGGVC